MFFSSCVGVRKDYDFGSYITISKDVLPLLKRNESIIFTSLVFGCKKILVGLISPWKVWFFCKKFRQWATDFIIRLIYDY